MPQVVVCGDFPLAWLVLNESVMQQSTFEMTPEGHPAGTALLQSFVHAYLRGSGVSRSDPGKGTGSAYAVLLRPCIAVWVAHAWLPSCCRLHCLLHMPCVYRVKCCAVAAALA